MINAFLNHPALQSTKLLLNEPMSRHTTFKIGGNAEILAVPDSPEAVFALVDTAIKEGIPYEVIGNGSNLLVSDKGIQGLVIKIEDGFKEIHVDQNVITAEAGALLSVLAKTALREGLGGLEFASGIPGTLGGAVMMNAGAYDGEMSQVVTEVVSINQKGEVLRRASDELDFSYRHSVFSSLNEIILSAKITLQKGDAKAIGEKMATLSAKRREKQPLEYPSAGSTFKRPQGFFAAKLIDDAGLRGFRVGGAEVSKKHTGFVVNIGDATASDVLGVMKHVKNTVEEKFQVTLEPEVRLLGDFEEEL